MLGPRTKSTSFCPSPFGVKVFGMKMSGSAQINSRTSTSTWAALLQMPSDTTTVKSVVAETCAVGSAMVSLLTIPAGDQK